jgi:adenosine deaminase
MDWEAKMIDNHLHYTGSLPRDYILAHLQERSPDFLKNNNIVNVSDFNNYIDSKFGTDYVKNRVEFDKIYTLFQSVTKPNDKNDILTTYESGAYQIAKTAIQNGLSEYKIISGPVLDIDKTHERYLGMIYGFEKAEKEFRCGYGKIIITFIRGANGKFKNYSDEILDYLFEIIKTSSFCERICGFDISGYEYPNKELFAENIEILNRIIDKRKQFGLDIDIGLHAGEIITNTNANVLYDDYFQKLANVDIQRIGHGTYLWYNNKTDILSKFAGKCIFDLCPTSNKVLTPVKEIPIKLFKSLGIKFTLNRDDPSIFGNWTAH